MTSFLPFVLVVPLLGGSVMAEENQARREEQRPHHSALDSEVVTKAKNGEGAAIRELAYRTSDESLRLLQELASTTTIPDEEFKKFMRGDLKYDSWRKKEDDAIYRRRSEIAKMALARRGDSKSLKDILNGLDSLDGWIRQSSIGALSFVGDARAAKYIAPFLFLKGGPKPRTDDESPTPFKYSAAAAMEALFPDVATEMRRKAGKSGSYFVEEWQKWWQAEKGNHAKGFDD